MLRLGPPYFNFEDVLVMGDAHDPDQYYYYPNRPYVPLDEQGKPMIRMIVLKDMEEQIVAEQANDIPRNIETDLAVQVNWYDRRGEFLLQDSQFNFVPVDFTAAQNADFTPEGGQSIATAHQEAIQRLAEQIVSQMESRW